MNDWKERLGGIVFSTNPDYKVEEEEEIPVAPPKSQQRLRVHMERAGRKGKVVTLIAGFVGSDEELTALTRMLKTRLGVGGSAKDGIIIIQGDFRDRVCTLLKSDGYSNTK